MARTKRANRPERRRTLEDSMGHGRVTVNGIEEDKDYYYHVANDKDNRVWELEQRGYEVVTKEMAESISMGDYNPSEVGTVVQTTADRKSGMKAVLMRCPKEFKEEDDAFRQKQIDKGEEAIFRTLKDEGQYGEIKKEDS